MHTATTSLAGSELLGQAHRVLDEAAGMLRRWDTPLESALLAVVDRRITDEVATMAVRLRGDGVATLLVNPAFVVDVGARGTAFVLCHEALHLLFNHLRHGGWQDPAWTLACEVVINHWVVCSTGQGLPRSAATGTTVGIDPQAVHAEYAEVVPDPVGYAEFVATDERCAAHLRLMPAEGRSASEVCAHQHHRGAPGDPGDAGDPGDNGGAGDAVERVLEQAVGRALAGDALVRQQLLDLEVLVPDAPVWGRIGISELRATTTRLGGTRLWQAQLAHVLGRTLETALKLRYDRKVGWWDAALLAPLGVDLDPQVGMPLLPGPAQDRRRQVAIYLDTSGSIHDETVQAAATTVGRIPDTVVHWHSFDHQVHPFEPGDAIVGGGGTSFDAVEADVVALDAELSDPLDAVLVLTDGYAEPIRPVQAHRWIWLIVGQGDTWPRQHGMRTVQVPELIPAGR